MTITPTDNRRVVNSNTQFPLSAVTAIDAQITTNNRTRNNRASGIVISPNHVLSAAHVSYSILSQRPFDSLRATTSNNEASLSSTVIGTPGDPPDNIMNRYYPADYPTTRKNEDDLVLLKTSNTLLSESQSVGLIAFVNLRSASGLTIETAGYPVDNVSSNIPNNSGQPSRDLVLSPGDGSIGEVVNISNQRRFFYSDNVDTASGQNGSGVWHTLEGDKPRVIGVHTTGGGSESIFPSTRNGGVLITKDIYDLIIKEIEKDFPGTANANLLPENAIIGTDPFISLDGNDNIVGTYRRERIIGKGGNDTLDGGDADDRLEGGNGNDVLFGGNGNDTLAGDGNSLENLLAGDPGIDTLVGDNGEDTFYIRKDDLIVGGGSSLSSIDSDFNDSLEDDPLKLSASEKDNLGYFDGDADNFVFLDDGNGYTATIVGYESIDTIDLSAFGVSSAGDFVDSQEKDSGLWWEYKTPKSALDTEVVLRIDAAPYELLFA